MRDKGNSRVVRMEACVCNLYSVCEKKTLIYNFDSSLTKSVIHRQIHTLLQRGLTAPLNDSLTLIGSGNNLICFVSGGDGSTLIGRGPHTTCSSNHDASTVHLPPVSESDSFVGLSFSVILSRLL